MDNRIITAEEKKKLDEQLQRATVKALTVMTDEQTIKLAGIIEGIMIANALNGKSA